ncbi:hypothetical protein BV20DRAFT_1112876 [Pilatotrama ljubarskyi]|nr:hypothetical protein BV20DRAFT_1112876 [Pilatotrama ljubarskyi]
MTSVRRCTRCVGPDGLRVPYQGHRCPYRKNHKTLSNMSPRVSTPVVDSSPSPSPPSTPPSFGTGDLEFSFAISSPFNPDTVHDATLKSITDYAPHTFDSFEPIRTPSAITPLARTPAFSGLLDTGLATLNHTSSIDHDTSMTSIFSDTDGIQLLGWDDGVEGLPVNISLEGMGLDGSAYADLEALLNLASPEPELCAHGVQKTAQGPELQNGLSSPGGIVTSLAIAHPRPPSDSDAPAGSHSPGIPSMPSPTPSGLDASVPDTEPQLPAPSSVACSPRAVAATGRNRKRARTDTEADEGNGDEDDNDTGLTFIENSTARTKAHSKRMAVLIKKAVALNVVTRPYILVYCSRPESVGHQNGKAISFISSNLKQILGEGFVQELHRKVANTARNVATDAQIALQTNLEVERLRQEREQEKARRVALEAQLDVMQQRLARLGLGQG